MDATPREQGTRQTMIRLTGIGKTYPDLAAVEASYKTFRGISALLN